MKKKIIIYIALLMFLATILFTLTGCTNKNEPTNPVLDINEVVKNQSNKVQNTDDNKDTSTEKEIEFKTVNYGDTISTEFVDMTIDSASSSEELYPTDTSGVYSYVKDTEGEKYFYLTGSLKNISGNSYDVQDIYAEMIFDNKYTYRAQLVDDNGGNDFYGHNVKPLGSVKYYLYSSIPDELIDSYNTCTIKFAFKENFEHDYHTDFSLYDYRYTITLDK